MKRLTEDRYWDAVLDSDRHEMFVEALAEIARLRAALERLTSADSEWVQEVAREALQR